MENLESTILEMMKYDLGISSESRDKFFKNIVKSAIESLASKGIVPNEGSDADTEYIMLVSSYAAWTYRKRKENVPMPICLQAIIRNRKMRKRANGK